MNDHNDRPDLELERLVMGDEVDGVRPSAGWLVRGVVELINALRDRVNEAARRAMATAADSGALFAEAAELRDQVEKLQGELAEAKRVAEAATEVYLKKFDADTATMELKSEAFKNLAEMAYSYAEACGMKNYVEATVKVGPLQAKDGEELFFVTLQRMDGKTPHELKVEAEQERDDLRDQVEALTVQLEEEERMVKRLREVVLGSPKWWVDTVPVGDRERPRLMTYQPTGSKGYYAVLVRLAPDGLGLAGEVDNKEGADA